MFIYLWKNKIDGKKYIGKCQAKETSAYIGSGKYFQRAVKKYGIGNFERTILEYCKNPEHLREREKYWLDFYDVSNNDMFYNISPNSGGGHHGADHKGTNNPMYGKKHPNHKPHYGSDNGMYGVHRYNSDNPNAKIVKITTPDGKQHVFNSLKEACQELRGSDEDYGKMKHLIKKCKEGKHLRKDSTFYGWQGEYLYERV